MRGTRLRASLLAITLLCNLASSASALPPHVVKAPTPGAINNLAPVQVGGAAHGALQEELGLLAYGHERQHPNGGQAQVTLVRLDAKGNPAAVTTSWKLPRPEALAKPGTFVAGLAFHPKLPLLYVWQDAAVHFDYEPRPRDPILKGLNRLCIYDVSGKEAELLASLCQGDEYQNGQDLAGVAVTADGAFLYIPNLRDPKSGNTFVGRWPLDADGLPTVLDEAATKLPRAERGKKLSEQAAAGPLAPSVKTPIYESGRFFPSTGHGTAGSLVPLGRDAALIGGGAGFLSWRPDDKAAPLNSLPVKGVTGPRIAVHPRWPAAFLTSFNSSSLARVDQADGYLTLLPEVWTLPEEHKLLSPPVLMPKHGKIAVGGTHFVYLFTLDAQGRPQGEATQTQVFSPAVRALLYSERFDRLYVPVELSK